MKLVIELPDNLNMEIDELYARQALVSTMYHNGKLSAHQAREILGMTRRAFEEMLPRYGFSILVDSPENIDIELNA